MKTKIILMALLTMTPAMAADLNGPQLRQIKSVFRCSRKVADRVSETGQGMSGLVGLMTELRDTLKLTEPNIAAVKKSCQILLKKDQPAQPAIQTEVTQDSGPTEMALRLLSSAHEAKCWSMAGFDVSAAAIVGVGFGVHAGICKTADGQKFLLTEIDGKGAVGLGAAVSGGVQYINTLGPDFMVHFDRRLTFISRTSSVAALGFGIREDDLDAFLDPDLEDEYAVGAGLILDQSYGVGLRTMGLSWDIQGQINKLMQWN